MRDLFQETAFGHIVYLLSGGKLFAYDEELDPRLIQKYTVADTPGSSHLSSNEANSTEKHTGDLEIGNDMQLIDWNENDRHNPRSWSTPKKLFVTCQICLLTTSVYIGSAIYTAGILDITEKFKVSDVKALLGLTLFVLGYALGPMTWVSSSDQYVNTVLTCNFTRLRCQKSHT